MIARTLLSASAAMLLLSASNAAALDIQDQRMLSFVGLLAALAMVGLVVRPSLATASMGWPMSMLLLLAVIALGNIGRELDFLDYRIALPILLLVLAPNIRAALGGLDLVRWALAALLLYVLATFASVVLGLPNVRNGLIDDVVRVDVTGSLILHASLCIIAAVALAATIREARSSAARALAIAGFAMAAYMLLLGATRTVVATLLVLAALKLAAGPRNLSRLGRVGLAILAASGLFALYSAMVDDSFWVRLSGSGVDDYSSGRWHSLGFWLAQAGTSPFGTGMGSVRRLLGEERPFIDGTRLLEWPHNEFVRFHVEAGIVGVLLVSLLVLGLTRRAIRHAASSTSLVERNLVLVIAADMIAQSLLQNYFNSVYHASIMVLVLALVTTHAAPRTEVAIERRRILEQRATMEAEHDADTERAGRAVGGSG